MSRGGKRMTLLSLQGVTRRFGGLVAVDAIDLEVAEGGVTAVIGPNGAGKTTLFNLISGFQTPNAGRIVFAGEDITARPPEAIAASGLVRTFQLVQLFQNLSVLENIQVGCHLHTKGGVLSALMRTRAHAAGRARGRGARPRTARLRRAGRRRRSGGERARLRPAEASRNRPRACREAQAPAARRARGRAFRG